MRGRAVVRAGVTIRGGSRSVTLSPPRVAIALGISVLMSAVAAVAQVAARNLVLMSHRNDYPTPISPFYSAYSACWSYIHGDGREYAVIAAFTGTAIYNVTDPSDPHLSGFI